jgi:hypothetical protein
MDGWVLAPGGCGWADGCFSTGEAACDGASGRPGLAREKNSETKKNERAIFILVGFQGFRANNKAPPLAE